MKAMKLPKELQLLLELLKPQSKRCSSLLRKSAQSREAASAQSDLLRYDSL